MRIVTICLAAILVVGTCRAWTGGARPPERAPRRAATVMPTFTVAPVPTSTVTPEPTKAQEETQQFGDSSDGYPSDGLGLSVADWEKEHMPSALEYTAHGQGYDGVYDVMIHVGNVWKIERQWSKKNRVRPDEARALAESLMPHDRQFIKEYSPDGRPETVVRLYHSGSLVARFDDADLSSYGGTWWFGGAEPGEFISLYNVHDNSVGRLIIGLGNNP
ncbi:MAG: hypothetical protein AAF702_44620 [Chloroflexota bacterium]